MTVKFAEVIEAIDRLSHDEQETLLDIVRRRVSEARRSELIAAVEEARTEYSSGDFQIVTLSELASRIAE